MSDQGVTAEEFQKARIQALNNLRNKPTTYWIEVIDPEPLPETLKKKKEIKFVIKPPTLAVLAEVALVLETLPQTIFEDEGLNAEALQHIEKICQMMAIVSHGKPKKPMPEWYVPFLTANLTVDEVLRMWFEVMQKMQTDFFLPFFQAAKQVNPMTMKKRTTTFSTLGGS